MLGRLSAAMLTKAKVAAFVAVSLTAGGVGGAVALSRVAPTSHLVRDSASTTPTDSSTPDPSTSAAPDPTPTLDGSTATPTPDDSVSRDDSVSPDGASSAYALPDCPADGANNHGDYTSSVARSAPNGRQGAHGDSTSQAARSDCGKPADPAAGDSADPPTPPADTPSHPVRPTHAADQGGGHGGGHTGTGKVDGTSDNPGSDRTTPPADHGSGHGAAEPSGRGGH